MSDSLRLVDVTKYFGGLTAVDRVSLTMHPGQVTGLIGPNGAGKSTAVDLISGYLKLSSGQICAGDVEIGTLAPHDIAKLGVARTFQTVRLYPEMSVEENVAAGAALSAGRRVRSLKPVMHRLNNRWRDGIHGAPGSGETVSSDTHIEELLDKFHIADVRKQLAVTLPYGLQRRVEIARALCRKPAYLLLDEPAAGMTDPEAADLGKRIRGIADEGVAVLLIEHNVRLVSDICNRLYVLNQGQVIAEGQPNSVMSDPSVVDAYLGAGDL